MGRSRLTEIEFECGNIVTHQSGNGRYSVRIIKVTQNPITEEISYHARPYPSHGKEATMVMTGLTIVESKYFIGKPKEG